MAELNDVPVTTDGADPMDGIRPLRPASRVRAAERTLMLLTLFTTSQQPDWTLDALARGAGLPKSTVHRLLETLESQGFVSAGEVRGVYRLGTNAAVLGHTAIRSRRPSPEVTAALTRVSMQVGGGVGISIRVNDEALIVERGSTGRAPSWRVGVGATLPCHATAVGHTLLAGLPDWLIYRMYSDRGRLPRRTPSSPGTATELIERVRTARDVGYAIDDEEFEVGLRCIGVPVTDAVGNVTHALGLTLRAADLAPPNVRQIVEPMQRLAVILGRHSGRLSPHDESFAGAAT